ncbi:MAG: hypothetical protein ACLFUG_12645, partial [Nitriliruptoraceae bacterium]
MPGPGRWTRAERLLLAAGLLGWVLLISWLRLPPWPSDQIHYFADAATLPEVTPGEEGVVGWHRALRLGLRRLLAPWPPSP